MQPIVYIDFTVDDLSLRCHDSNQIPAENQNYIYSRFYFSEIWDGATKRAIFSKGDIILEPILIEDDACQVPNQFLTEPGVIRISVIAGNRLVTNTSIIQVIPSNFKEGEPLTPPEYGHVYVQSPEDSITHIRENEDGEFQYFTRGEWHTVKSNSFALNLADVVSNDIENALVLGTDDKLYVPKGANPYVLYFARYNGRAIITQDKPTESQMIVNRQWRPATWGEWGDIATFDFEESLLRAEADIVLGNIVTAKLWLSSDIAIPNAQFRLTITDKADNTDLAEAFTTVDLNNINTILTPATFLNKFRVSRTVPLNQIQVTLSVMVLTAATQFGVVSELPGKLSFTTIMSMAGITE